MRDRYTVTSTHIYMRICVHTRVPSVSCPREASLGRGGTALGGRNYTFTSTHVWTCACLDIYVYVYANYIYVYMSAHLAHPGPSAPEKEPSWAGAAASEVWRGVTKHF